VEGCITGIACTDPLGPEVAPSDDVTIVCREPCLGMARDVGEVEARASALENSSEAVLTTFAEFNN